MADSALRSDKDSGLAHEQSAIRATGAHRIWRAFGLPEFSDNSERLTAEVLVAWIFCLALCYFVLVPPLIAKTSFLFAARIIAPQLSVAIVSFWLVQRRRLKIASCVLCYGLTAGLINSTYHSGGLNAAGAIGFVVPPIVAGLTAGRNQFLIVTLIVTVAVMCIAALQELGRLPSIQYIQPAMTRAAVIIIVCCGVSTMVWWANHRLEHAQARLLEEIEVRKAAELAILRINEELEVRVKERTADLDAFTAMVAHDLRSPIRIIDGYASILLEQSPNLNEESTFAVSRLVSATKGMRDLVDHMLQFSREQREPERAGSIDMTELVQGLRYQMIESGTIEPSWIHVEPLPPTISDLALIRQVWANLLDNAVKYSRHREEPRVRVFSETIEGIVWYAVQDNGIGFDSAHNELVFERFRRVNTREEIPGSGVGLASVKRIVEKLGGRVVAQGELDHGAKLAFCLCQGREPVIESKLDVDVPMTESSEPLINGRE